MRKLIKRLTKKAAQPLRLEHRCRDEGCGQFQRTLHDLIIHEDETPHCSKCGFGLSGYPGASAAAKFCLACELDVASFPKDKLRRC